MPRPAAKDPIVERRIFSTRTLLGGLIVLLCFSGIAYRYYYLQVVQYDNFHTQSERNRVHIRSVAPIRGLIFDRNGVLLADNRPSYQLGIVKERVEDLDKTLETLQQLLAFDEELIHRFHKRGRRPFEAIPLKLQLSEKDMAIVAVNSHRLAGVEIEARSERYYPHGELFAHVLGYVGRINEKEKKRIDEDNYAGTHTIGKTGVEKFYETSLHGQVGHENVETNARGRVLRSLERTDALQGADLILHLDANLQKVAYEKVKDKRAAVVALDPTTGGVLAMVSTPSFDPNLFVGGISSKSYNKLRENLDLPLFNRTIQGQYPPGSTVKPMMALAGLHYGLVDASYSVLDPGWYQLPNDERFYRDWKKKGHGHRVNLHTSIVQSCDVYFYDLAFRMGVDRMHDFAVNFGLGSKTGIDVPGEKPGLMPSSAWKKRRMNLAWYPGETLNVGIGQGYMLATPLQLASMTATLATRGDFIQPKVLKSVSGEVPEHNQRRQFRVVNENAWRQVEKAMRDVVSSPRGTAQSINRNLSYSMGGKTGTAQVVGIAQDAEYDSAALEERQRDHALFVGFAPLSKPEIVVAVIIENGEKSSSAAKVVRAVMDEWFSRKFTAEQVAGNDVQY